MRLIARLAACLFAAAAHAQTPLGTGFTYQGQLQASGSPYSGPADLTLGLTGREYSTGFDREEPEVVKAIKNILAAAHRSGIKAALHCGTPAYAAKAAGWGFDLVTVSNDVRLLAGAAAASVQAFRTAVGESKTPQENQKGY